MSKPHRKSLIRQVQERLDDLMALGESRYEAKLAREEGHTPAFSTGKIHSYKTRSVYQEHAMRFVRWVRDAEGIKELEQVNQRADELASRWLQVEIEAGKSPYTLQTERAALRLFFGDRELASSVQLPKRLGKDIARSRGPAARDCHFQPTHWPEYMVFQGATGLRKGELQRIRVGDVSVGPAGELVAYVRSGKGGRPRNVPILADCELAVLALVMGRNPDEAVLKKVPDADHHALRRAYAQALYRQYAPGAPSLPPKPQRLKPTDYDREAVLRVSAALGHSRCEVVLNNYLR